MGGVPSYEPRFRTIMLVALASGLATVGLALVAAALTWHLVGLPE